MMKQLASLVLIIGACALAPAVHAQTYPSKPIRLMVPFEPGAAGVDFAVRQITPKMSEGLGQPVVIENRAGANGMIGTELVTRAAPDGHTLLLGVFGPLTVMPHLVRLPYDPRRDLAPVALMVSVPNLVVVPAASPLRTMQDFLAAARARPGQLSYGSMGTGSSGQLSAGLLATMGEVRLLNIPYSGGAPAQLDLMAGRLDVMFDNAPGAIPRVREGLFRPLAITSLARSPVLPEVPTVAELGFPGYEVATWMGLLVPAGTPPPIIAALHAALVATLAEPALRARLTAQMYDVLPGTPEEFARYIAAETEKWGQVVRDNNIRAD
jgi:tripartite-type tricarboxylate transporter receptor subunit TctC